MKYIGAIFCLFIITGCSTPQLETRVYRVDDLFWRVVDAGGEAPKPDDELSHEFQVFLEDVFPHPIGAFAELNRTNSTVILRNTTKTLDTMEKDLGPMDGSGVFYKERLK